MDTYSGICAEDVMGCLKYIFYVKATIEMQGNEADDPCVTTGGFTFYLIENINKLKVTADAKRSKRASDKCYIVTSERSKSGQVTK